MFSSFRPIAATTALSVRRISPGVDSWKTLSVQCVPSTWGEKVVLTRAWCRNVITQIVFVIRVVVAVVVVLVILKGFIRIRLSITPTMSAVITIPSGAPELL